MSQEQPTITTSNAVRGIDRCPRQTAMAALALLVVAVSAFFVHAGPAGAATTRCSPSGYSSRTTTLSGTYAGYKAIDYKVNLNWCWNNDNVGRPLYSGSYKVTGPAATAGWSYDRLLSRTAEYYDWAGKGADSGFRVQYRFQFKFCSFGGPVCGFKTGHVYINAHNDGTSTYAAAWE